MMSTAAKLVISVVATIVLVFGVEFAVVALMSDVGLLQILKGMALFLEQLVQWFPRVCLFVLLCCVCDI
jgi:hypothetical protein